MTQLDKLMYEFERSLLSVDRLAARRIFGELGENRPSIQLVEQLIVPALERIGAAWEQGSIALSQVYMSGRICEDLVHDIFPLHSPDKAHQPKMAIAVLQDYHLLGKRIVYSALRASGYDLQDYGRVEADDLVNRINRDGIKVLLVSTLMLPSALRVKDVRKMLHVAGNNVKIVVGGAPFRLDDQLWKEVGADAMGRNAPEAIRIITTVIGDLS